MNTKTFPFKNEKKKQFHCDFILYYIIMSLISYFSEILIFKIIHCMPGEFNTLLIAYDAKKLNYWSKNVNGFLYLKYQKFNMIYNGIV